MALHTDIALRLYRQITLDEPKPHNLTDEESKFWDKLSVEVKDLKKQGKILDAPFEWPNP